MGHTTNIGNFSVASVEFGVDSGTNISATQSTAVLTLIPDAGYTITAGDFSYTSGPSQVSGVTFAQSGQNVIATVTFNTNAVMPSSDLDIPICISGESGEVSYTLSGNINVIASSNVTPSSGNIAYTASGNTGDTVQVFSQTISADTGYFFPDPPTGSLTSGNSSSYTFTTTEGLNNDGEVISKTFIANYTFGSQSVSGDVFTIVADADLIPVIVSEITSYTFSTVNIDGDGETRSMVVFGTPGAEFSLNVVNEDGTPVSLGVINNQVIPGSGSFSFNITFPAVTDNDDYDFTLTGDGVSNNFNGTGQQPSTFTVNQYVDINLTFGLTTQNSNITPGATISFLYEPDKTLSTTDSNYSFTGTLVATSTATITENVSPTVNDFTNLNPNNNGGTSTTINSVSAALSNNDLTYTVTFSGTTTETGIADVLSTLNLDYLITTNSVPVAYTVTKTINEDETNPANLVVQLLASDGDNDPLTYTLLGLPVNGDLYASTDTSFTTPLTAGAITGSSFLYKPDANFNGNENFNYKVNDGTVDSNNAPIAITVTPVNDHPIITSTAPTFTGTVGQTYTYNFTYSDVDHTDAEITMSTQNSLPSGWTLTDNNNGTGTLSGTVAAGQTTIVLVATDPVGDADSETIIVSAAYDILTNMEFLVSYRSNAIAASTSSGQSPKTTSAINLSAKPTSVSGHTCNNADFILLAETTDSSNNTVRFIIGQAHLGNTSTTSANSVDHNLKSSEWSNITLPVSPVSNGASGLSNNARVNTDQVDLNSNVYDHQNTVSGTYAASNPNSYYISGSVGSSHRSNYLTINNTLAAQMASTTSTGVFTIRLAPDSWRERTGVTETNTSIDQKYAAFAHASAAWLQIFKENSAGTNQEEVLDSNGNSFGVTSASNVSINIFNNTVTVS
jgi:hypothetical protein